MKSKLFPLYCFLWFMTVSVFSDSIYGQENNTEVAIKEKSDLKITNPTISTLWKIPNTISLEWTTSNIGTEKNIRFFLVRDEMVAQELGIFPNTGSAENIELAKNVGAGNKYQVMGIELFPDDKYNIAKFVTPLFTIEKEDKKSSDVVKQTIATVSQKATEPIVSKKEKRRLEKEKKKAEKLAKKNIEKEAEKQAVASNNRKKSKPVEETKAVEPQAPKLREEFVGRNITYVDELAFDGTEISLYIWDHGRQDGDIVSIYLNGEPVISKYYLTYWKKEIKIKIDPTKKNDLFLYAHNLGSAPPNTVSLKITDGTTTSEDIILNSDLKSCEAVSISVNK